MEWLPRMSLAFARELLIKRQISRRGPAAALIVVPILLGGCISMDPAYERPAAPVRTTWSPDAAAPAITPAATIGWREFYADPELQALIGQALDNNRDLRIGAARVAQSLAAYGIQRAEQYPWIGASADGTRARVPGDLNLTGRPLISSQYQVGVGLSTWEIDFWGRIRSLKDAALQNYLASDAAQRAVTLSIITQVAQTYLAIRELDERIALAKQTTDTRAESLRIFTRREQVGSASKLELTEVITLYQQARALVTQLEQDRATQSHALEVLVGAPVDVKPAIGLVNDAELMRQIDAGLPSEQLENRPDIVSAEHQLMAENANIGAARAAFFPRVTLTGFAGTASADLDGLFRGGSGVWSFAPSISIPIFQGGQLRSNLDLAKARRVEAVAQYEKTIQNAFRDVADALSAQRWLAEQVDILQLTQAAQAERRRLAKLRYDNGAAAFLEVLDAERDLLAIEQQAVQSRRALLASRVSLYAALGGGTAVASPPEAAAPEGAPASAAPDAKPSTPSTAR
ncbi:efflux transporter outer membrane subunit [Cupriavidus metallidurans]|uniref:RND efflux system, outer membrane lipoprotein, NodT n=2 Tax=Cupriavidus metallidurans TaxID=119219 RepID=Q1LMQ9_CUPMC|nr:efflux transporter outer membrane subunit [Cupriavidus metallidurans]ABF08567.1 RND efflux system, outer membrane lipoprotein, NodT [Cupriavidus metallidurans CH34]MDE4917904.1 efflux transporter outer membrane subunit [Cupriavidus metallidurans]